MPTPRPSAARIVAAALAAVLASIAVVVTITDDDQDGRPDRIDVTINIPTVATVDGPDRGLAPDTVVTADRDQVKAIADSDSELRAGADLRSTPSDVPHADARAGQKQADQVADADPLPPQAGLGAAESAPGCRTANVSNQSSREGTRPIGIGVHYPVARNIPGLADMNSLISWLDNPAAKVSYHRIYDWDANCALTVPETRKAWAIAGFNRLTVNYSMMGRGAADGKFATVAGLRKMATDMARTAERWDIPIRHGRVSGCTIVVTGIIEHGDAGACGGGHVDITPWSIDAVIAQVKLEHARLYGGGRTPSTATERRRCGALAYHRRKVRTGQGYWTTTRARRVRYLKTTLARAGIDASRCR